MLNRRFLAAAFVVLFLVASWSTNSIAGTKLYQGSWIAESFGNDKVGGTGDSQYFSVLGIPQGQFCAQSAPLCDLTSTPVTTLYNGTKWAPLGPDCRPLTAGEKPRPPKGGTLTPSGATCPNPPYCQKTAPLYRNTGHFTGGGAPTSQTCTDASTVLGVNKAIAFLPPGDPQRGIGMKGHPLTGSASATTTGTAFKLPAAAATPGPGNGMRKTTLGSFITEYPYLYSYSYADLRNDAGTFAKGQGFFATTAATTALTFTNLVGASPAAKVKVKRGSNTFGGVMRLLGSYTNKVCYFYQGGCGLGYGDWAYEYIGAGGYKDSKAGSPVITRSYTTNFSFAYFNTALETTAKYDVVAQRFPWTTGTVTVSATGRGPAKTYEVRKGFDNRTSGGYGTVQLVSPLLTQWLAQTAGGEKFETGGIAIMQVKFVPEPGGIASMVAGLSMLLVFRRFRS
jgi:hypothetical protein